MSEEESKLQQVRKRPGMYVGSTEFWGFVNYVVCAYRLLIYWGATRIDLAPGETLTLSSDAVFPANIHSENPFDTASKNLHHVDAFLLNAFSQRINICDEKGTAFAYERGIQVSSASEQSPVDGVTLRFAPDHEIFSVTELQPAVIASYLNRMSFLHPNIQFTVSGEGTAVYSHPGGIAEMFIAASSPYQLLHEPIQVSGSDSDFEMQLVFAFHSWEEKITWTFANYGRVIDGGTHDVGLRCALDDFATNVISNLDDYVALPGYLAIMSFTYPNVRFAGCIKAKIENDELEAMTRDLVSKSLRSIDEKSLAQLKFMRRFMFPDFFSLS